jgi:hypothetical protein
MAPRRWREEFLQLGADLSGGGPADVTEWYRVRLERMHALLPNGKPYPAHAEAFVISPEMHNVVRAGGADGDTGGL